MTELIGGRGDQGVVTAAIPGLVSGFQLDPCDAPVNLLHLTIEAVVPEYGDRSVTLDFVDGLQGSGQEVQNRLTVNRNSTLPEFGSCEVTISAQGKYGGGTGEPNDPYQIWDANDMQAIGADANDWDRCFVLMADIDLSAYTGEEFNIIGYASANPWDGQPFFGVFDGNDHTISNFTYVSDGRSFAGLFGVVGGEIKNLRLIDPNVNAGRGIMRRRREVVGSLTGFLIDESAVTNCYSKGGSVTGDRVVGGLVGRNSRGAIILSYWDIETSGEPNMCDNPEDPNCDNSHGLPTSQLHQQSTFQDWDFINVWNIGENQTYPYLRTVSASDINKDRITNFLDLCIVGEQWMDEE